MTRFGSILLSEQRRFRIIVLREVLRETNSGRMTVIVKRPDDRFERFSTMLQSLSRYATDLPGI